MAIMIPDTDEYRNVEEAVGKMAEQVRRSKTKMAVILIEEALKARLDGSSWGRDAHIEK